MTPMKKSLLVSIVLLLNIAAFAQPVCGGIFTDPAGASANYSSNSNYTVTIYPTNPGDIVSVTFTSFDTEANWDALYVFDGNSISARRLPVRIRSDRFPEGSPAAIGERQFPARLLPLPMTVA